MSNKGRIQVTVDPLVLKRFDERFDNRSKQIQKFMKKTVEIEGGKNRDLVEEKQNLEEEIEKLESEIEELKADKASKESELKTIKSALEQEKEKEQKTEQAIEALAPKWQKFRRKTHDPEEATKRLASTEAFHKWLDQVAIYKEELKQKIRENAEAKYQ